MKKENVTERQKSVEKNLRENSSMKIEDLFEKLGTSYGGVSIVDVEDRLGEYGKNTIEIKNENTILHKLREATINPFNIVLILVAVITFITDVILATNKDYATFSLIVGTIFISAIISLMQQTKSDNAAKKLKKMITNKMEVIRDEVQSTVDIAKETADIILLEKDLNVLEERKFKEDSNEKNKINYNYDYYINHANFNCSIWGI